MSQSDSEESVSSLDYYDKETESIITEAIEQAQKLTPGTTFEIKHPYNNDGDLSNKTVPMYLSIKVKLYKLRIRYERSLFDTHTFSVA
jgi:hypothetical protein